MVWLESEKPHKVGFPVNDRAEFFCYPNGVKFLSMGASFRMDLFPVEAFRSIHLFPRYLRQHAQSAPQVLGL